MASVAALIVACTFGVADAGPAGAPTATRDVGGEAGPTLPDLPEGVERPVKLSGPDPRYTPDALSHRIEGTGSYRCILYKDGTVHDCTIVKALPFEDAVIIQTLEARRYKPVMVSGKPVSVKYTFNITLRLPQEEPER